jgi:hypothetical protein
MSPPNRTILFVCGAILGAILGNTKRLLSVVLIVTLGGLLVATVVLLQRVHQASLNQLAATFDLHRLIEDAPQEETLTILFEKYDEFYPGVLSIGSWRGEGDTIHEAMQNLFRKWLIDGYLYDPVTSPIFDKWDISSAMKSKSEKLLLSSQTSVLEIAKEYMDAGWRIIWSNVNDLSGHQGERAYQLIELARSFSPTTKRRYFEYEFKSSTFGDEFRLIRAIDFYAAQKLLDPAIIGTPMKTLLEGHRNNSSMLEDYLTEAMEVTNYSGEKRNNRNSLLDTLLEGGRITVSQGSLTSKR